MNKNMDICADSNFIKYEKGQGKNNKVQDLDTDDADEKYADKNEEIGKGNKLEKEFISSMIEVSS